MKKYFLYIATLLACCGACTERFNIDTDNAEPRLVIIGYITTEQGVHFVQVSRTTGYFGHEVSKIYSEASVKINGISLSYDHNGYYKTSDTFQGIPGNTYNLEVMIDFDGDGKEEYYTASTTIPNAPVLDSVALGAIQSNNPLGPPWVPLIYFQDVPGVNHYGAHLYINQLRKAGDDTKFAGKYSANISNYFLNMFDERAEEGSYFNPFPLFTYYIEEEMGWKDDTKIYLQPGDTISIELNLLSPEYFDFLRTAKEEINGGIPLFAGPPANIPGNISGNALGVFGSYTVSRKSLILPAVPGFPSH